MAAEPDSFTASDSAISDGQAVGGVSAGITLGLLGSSCATPVTAEFVLYESIAGGGGLAYPGNGANPFGAMVTDPDGDGFANSTSPFVDLYPVFYESLFDPDLDYAGGTNGPLSSIQPIARYTGATRVPLAGGSWQLLSILVFDSTALASFSADADNNPSSWGRAARAPGDSRIIIAVLNNPAASIGAPEPVTDFCSPLSMTAMLKATSSGGQARYRTPATAGTRSFGVWSYSLRDQEGDGKDNQLDTCPYAANTGSDPDNDGIDSACDPTPTINTGAGDHDGDGFLNRGDNCPLVANGGSNQRDGENSTTYLIAAPYGGPRTDGIGDQCDAAPTVANGAFIEHYASVPKCIGGTDADGDGYCAAQDPNDASASVKGYSLNGGPDQDGVPGGDGFGANVEVYVGTAPLVRCPATATPNDEVVDAWPADFDDNQSVNTTDVLALKAWYGSSVPPAPARYDIMPSKSVNTSDVLAQKPHFGTTCVPPPP